MEIEPDIDYHSFKEKEYIFYVETSVGRYRYQGYILSQDEQYIYIKDTISKKKFWLPKTITIVEEIGG